MAMTSARAGQPPGVSWCKVCGEKCRKTGQRWRHMSPTPSGAPHEHNAVPGALKPSARTGAAAPGWHVCDMDDGVLRVELSRRAALRWALTHFAASKVAERHAHGPGYYGYVLRGRDSTDHAADIAVVRGDRLAVYGLRAPNPRLTPLYPIPAEPWTGVERC